MDGDCVSDSDYTPLDKLETIHEQVLTAEADENEQVGEEGLNPVDKDDVVVKEEEFAKTCKKFYDDVCDIPIMPNQHELMTERIKRLVLAGKVAEQRLDALCSIPVDKMSRSDTLDFFSCMANKWIIPYNDFTENEVLAYYELLLHHRSDRVMRASDYQHSEKILGQEIDRWLRLGIALSNNNLYFHKAESKVQSRLREWASVVAQNADDILERHMPPSTEASDEDEDEAEDEDNDDGSDSDASSTSGFDDEKSSQDNKDNDGRSKHTHGAHPNQPRQTSQTRRGKSRLRQNVQQPYATPAPLTINEKTVIETSNIRQTFAQIWNMIQLTEQTCFCKTQLFLQTFRLPMAAPYDVGYLFEKFLPYSKSDSSPTDDYLRPGGLGKRGAGGGGGGKSSSSIRAEEIAAKNALLLELRNHNLVYNPLDKWFYREVLATYGVRPRHGKGPVKQHVLGSMSYEKYKEADKYVNLLAEQRYGNEHFTSSISDHVLKTLSMPGNAFIQHLQRSNYLITLKNGILDLRGGLRFLNWAQLKATSPYPECATRSSFFKAAFNKAWHEIKTPDDIRNAASGLHVLKIFFDQTYTWDDGVCPSDASEKTQEEFRKYHEKLKNNDGWDPSSLSSLHQILAVLGRTILPIPGTSNVDNWEIAPWFIGEGGTGKSLICALLRLYHAIVKTITDGAEGTFGFAGVHKATLVHVNELFSAISLGILNSIISREVTSVAEKYSGPVEGVVKASLIVSSNTTFKDDKNQGGNRTRRFLFINHRFRIKNADPNLLSKILTHEQALLFLVISLKCYYLLRPFVLNRGGFYEIAHPRFIATRDSFDTLSNSLNQFFADRSFVEIMPELKKEEIEAKYNLKGQESMLSISAATATVASRKRNRGEMQDDAQKTAKKPMDRSYEKQLSECFKQELAERENEYYCNRNDLKEAYNRYLQLNRGNIDRDKRVAFEDINLSGPFSTYRLSEIDDVRLDLPPELRLPGLPCKQVRGRWILGCRLTKQAMAHIRIQFRNAMSRHEQQQGYVQKAPSHPPTTREERGNKNKDGIDEQDEDDGNGDGEGKKVAGMSVDNDDSIENKNTSAAGAIATPGNAPCQSQPPAKRRKV